MKTSAFLPALILLSVFSTTGSTMALPIKIKKPAAAPVEKTTTPEITTAETRVNQAKAQVDVANKQLNASKALLRAAQADLKAAEADLSALQLKAEAQGLVDETGMTPAKAAPVAVASSEAPKPEAQDNQDTRIRSVEFNGAPVENQAIQLR
ncbi:MAG: hypothetical protein K2W82_13550 [Candidatus Obscuribacterales bacterium]|nr:hypothetical protein [Candidatus Obscuribacterales bacterium]